MNFFGVRRVNYYSFIFNIVLIVDINFVNIIYVFQQHPLAFFVSFLASYLVNVTVVGKNL